MVNMGEIVDKDKWSELKREVMERDKNTCLYCYRKDKDLTIKNVFRRDGTNLEDHMPSDFITICLNCLQEERKH